MNEILQALTAIPVDAPTKDEEAQWIHIMPSGTFNGYDGRGPYVLQDAGAVIAASTRPATEMVIDRDHEIFYAPEGTHKAAAGWIKELESREDGIWGRVEWTWHTKYQLANKEYRYLSPVFAFNEESGEIKKIHHVSLTNNPNLEMTAVASAFMNPKPTKQKEENKMNKHLLAIAAALGLANTATPEEIVTAAQQTAAGAIQIKTDYASVVKALGVDEDAESTIVVAAASQKLETGDKKPDPSQFVPMSVHTETTTKLAELQKTVFGDKASAAVDAAMEAGKVSPAQKAWATDYASADPKGFAKFVEGAPKIVADDTATAASKESGASKLSDEDVAVCSQLGISQEDFSKTEIKQEAA